MRLSDAMMLGGALKCHVNRLANHDEDAGCAMQLAKFAVGMTVCDPYPDALEKFWPWTLEQQTNCPACDVSSCGVDAVIANLNDVHKWNLERIADWVRSIEPPEPSEFLQEIPADKIQMATVR